MPNPILLTNPVRPTWKWDFTTGKAPGNATYTGSGGTYFNSYGVLTSATTNVPRFDYDPATLSPLGYLAEMASTNSLTRSQEFDNADWTTQNSTVTANQTTAPDGTATADKVTENSSATVLHAVFNRSALAGNSIAGFSCFFKAGTRSKFYICMRGTTNDWVTAVFDTVGGTTAASQTSTGATSGTLVSTYMRSVGNGWYRCSLIAQVVNANAYFFTGLAPLATGNTFSSNGDVTYTGDGSSYGYFWGAQADSAGVGVTSYIPTAGATASRTQDVLSLPLTSLPGWSATQGGVLVAAYRLHTLNPATPGNNQPTASIDDGNATGSNSVINLAKYGGDNTFGGFFVSGGSLKAILSGASSAVFVRRKQAVGWDTNRQIVTYDGQLLNKTTQTLALPVSPTHLRVGWYANTGLATNGTLESIAYYKGARSDAFVQAVSR